MYKIKTQSLIFIDMNAEFVVYLSYEIVCTLQVYILTEKTGLIFDIVNAETPQKFKRSEFRYLTWFEAILKRLQRGKNL